MEDTCHRTLRVFPKNNKNLSIGFNSGRYDLQLIRKYFITHLGQENVLSGEKQGQIMYMSTPQFKFLDFINYLAAGATYDKWVKTCGAKQTKSWLPYEWFDGADKLDYKGLPPYWCWYSQLRNSFALTPKEYEECKRVFEEQGMKTFRDWLEYYNLVFTCKHVAGETRIRSHKYDLARIVKRILGFDANSLYPRTMAKEMPCGKEFVEHYEDPVQAAKKLIPRM